MKASASADVVIFGGGIAGLWLLTKLRASGYSAILFESGALGGGQTHKSQGIIHGGMKYALQGVLTAEATGMAEIPAIWQACLTGRGEVNLSGVPILSERQYLWAPNKFTSKLTGFLAGATLESKVETLPKDSYPTVFKHAAFKGEVFALNEMVLDVHSLVRELFKANQDAIFQIEPLCEDGLCFSDDGKLRSANVYMSGRAIEISAQYFIFTAGAGNEVILPKLKTPNLAMQRRPLHMVLAKLPFHQPLYAHCLGLSSRPRVTITTHHTHDGASVWYLGGALAEEGVKLDSAAQIQATRTELRNLFPWLDFTGTEFSTFLVDRAEPLQKNGMKPETSFYKAVRNMIVAWPTKLALAPKLASDVLGFLQQKNLSSQLFDLRELRAWPMPPIAVPVWEDAFCKSVA